MSYLHPDGTPDTDVEILESARCFVAVLSRLLEPSEGMVVELVFQENFPDDKYGKYLVWRDDAASQIKVNQLTVGDELYDADAGQLVWVHEHEQVH